jgi:NTP pyrophosphatase (non-canonical NTP hydrolase)
MAKRKRGRPPAGGFSTLTAVTSLRMPEDLRQQLEKARKERGKRLNRKIGLSQELLYRVRSSFIRERDEARDPALRALYYLIAEVAEAVSFPFPARPAGLRPLWRSDPFLFEAFRLAVGELLDALKPTGRELKPPSIVANTFKTAEELADYVVSGVLHALKTGEQSEKEDQKFMWWEAATRDYQMFDARRDLGVKSPGEKS